MTTKGFRLQIYNADAWGLHNISIVFIRVKGYNSNLKSNQILLEHSVQGSVTLNYEIDTNGNIIKSNSVLTLNISDLLTGGGRKLALLLGLLLLCGKGVER